MVILQNNRIRVSQEERGHWNVNYIGTESLFTLIRPQCLVKTSCPNSSTNKSNVFLFIIIVDVH